MTIALDDLTYVVSLIVVSAAALCFHCSVAGPRIHDKLTVGGLLQHPAQDGSQLSSPTRPTSCQFKVHSQQLHHAYHTFCRVTGNCLLKPLKLPSDSVVKALFTSSWYLFSAFAISRTSVSALLPLVSTFFDVDMRTLPSS